MNRALSNIDIKKYAQSMQIPFFRGVYMRDSLPKKPKKFECFILNHDSIKNSGTHWSALAKIGKVAYYFDSFGKLPPPHELVTYLDSDKTEIRYNYARYQKFNTVICGQLCLMFLYDLWCECMHK